LKPKIIISGTGAITAEIHETALLLDYDVLNLNPRDKLLSVDSEVIAVTDIPDEFRLLPIIMSTSEYDEFINLPFDRKWVQNYKKLFQQTESLGFKRWTSIFHPSAVISPSAKIGVNVFINANSTISINSTISDNTFINRDVSIGHDVVIGCFTNVAPGVTITGSTSIQDSVFIGAGSIIINGIVVGSGATVAAGSIVTRNVRDLSLVMGAPARRKNIFFRNIRRNFTLQAIKYLKKLGIFTLAKQLYSKLKY
jgi:sugar O-acyltransferase (sialic acid O-acetyltransferase NeuD family)